MSEQLLERTLALGDMEIRGDGRTVYGLMVPFDREATVNDGFGPYREVFRYGAYTRSINAGVERVKAFVNHNHRERKLPIGKAVMLREDRAGLVGELRISKTRDGDEALELVRDGALDSFSVGFGRVPDKERKTKDLVERLEVKLREVSLVAFPAYEGAVVSGIRNGHPTLLPPIEELERLLALAKDLATHDRELVEDTSQSDPAAIQDDSVVGHSSRTPTREQRIAALILRGIPHDTNRTGSSAA